MGAQKEEENVHNFPVYTFDKESVGLPLGPKRYLTYGEVVEFLLPDGTIVSNTYFDYRSSARCVIDEVQKNGADYLGIAVYHRNLV